MQPKISTLFQAHQPFAKGSPRHNSISKAIAEFVIVDMQQLSVVDGPGFKNLVQVLEHRYAMISRKTLLENY